MTDPSLTESIDSIESDTGRFAQVPEWLIHRCKPRSLVVYVHLAVQCDYSDGAVKGMSHGAIASAMGCSTDTILRSLMELRDVGAVHWVPTTRPDGSPGFNRYRITRVKPVDKGYRKSAVSPQGCGLPTRKDAVRTTRELLIPEGVDQSEVVDNERVPVATVKAILASVKSGNGSNP